MEPTSNTPGFQEKRLSRGVKILIGFGVFLLLAILAFALWRTSLASKNAARLKAITDAGEPASARELNSWYTYVDDKENAALVWLEGIAKLNPPLQKGQTPPWASFKLLPLGERFDQTQLDEAAALLASNTEALGLFHRAAAMPKSRYPLDLSQSTYATLAHLSPLKASGELLQLAALTHAHGGRGREAAAALEDILAAARTLSQEPVQISQSVRHLLNLLAVSTTERVIHLTPLAETELAQLQAAFAQADDSNTCARALAGERACIITLLNAPDEIDPPTNDPQFERDVKGKPRRLVRLTGFYQRELGFFLNVMSAAIATSKLDDPQRFINRPDDNTVHDGEMNGPHGSFDSGTAAVIPNL